MVLFPGISFSYVVASAAWVPGRRRLREPSIRSRLTTEEGAMDQAARLLKQAPFDSATVRLLCCVLEDGWAQIRTSYTSPRAEEIGRCNVADGILAYARAGQRDPEALKIYAVTRALSLLSPVRAGPKRNGV